MNIIFLSIAYRLSISLHSTKEVPDSRGTRQNRISIALLRFCLIVPFIIPSAVLLSVLIGVGGVFHPEGDFFECAR